MSQDGGGGRFQWHGFVLSFIFFIIGIFILGLFILGLFILALSIVRLFIIKEY
jgi:hypothetical protein